MCHTRWGRDYQRQNGVYEIIKSTHMNETVDKVRASYRFPSVYMLTLAVDFRAHRTLSTAAARRRAKDNER